MKKLLVLLLLGSSLSYGQVNLVPNFSFEQKTNCPTTADQIIYADGWSKYSSNVSSPDYFNACAPSSGFGVPDNVISFQPDHRNCSAYAGVVTRGGSANDREYIGIQLSQPLSIGQKYFMSFYTVMGSEKPFAGDYYSMPSNNIGLRLSTIEYSDINPCPISNWAHVNYSSILNDSINWTRVYGSIVADSAYDYIILGNFFDDANTDTMTYNCPTCFNEYSYYLIDDVCLSTDSTLCNGGIDLLPCNVSVSEYNLNGYFEVFPNPAKNYISIRNEENIAYDITVTNSVGQYIYLENNISSNQIDLDITDYESGLLFIKIQSEQNQFIYKILKE